MMILKKILLYPLAILIIAWEELFYYPIAWVGLQLGKNESWRRLQVLIAQLPPVLALMVFVLPVVVLFPFKIFALWLIAHHHEVIGAGVFVVAKILGAALFTRIFMLTEPSIRRIAWIDRGLTWFFNLKDKIKNYWRQSRAYVHLKNMRQIIRFKLTQMKSKLKAQFNPVNPDSQAIREDNSNNSNNFLAREKAEIKRRFWFKQK